MRKGAIRLMQAYSFRRCSAVVAQLLAISWLSLSFLARADAPPCRYELTSDTVLDRTTKLTWQRTLDGTLRTQEEAETYCSGLSIAGAGFRLPTVKELQTIVEVSRHAPALDTNAFPGILGSSSMHWTSSRYAKDDSNAWYVQFVDGSVYWKPVSERIYVRCVKP